MANSITLNWCEKHKKWYVTECPECYLDINEEGIKREGRREVVITLEKFAGEFKVSLFRDVVQSPLWQAKLKEWGIE